MGSVTGKPVGEQRADSRSWEQALVNEDDPLGVDAPSRHAHDDARRAMETSRRFESNADVRQCGLGAFAAAEVAADRAGCDPPGSELHRSLPSPVADASGTGGNGLGPLVGGAAVGRCAVGALAERVGVGLDDVDLPRLLAGA